MVKIDILTYLSRNDKWYLGGGEALVWAPTHPQWLDQLGFWDGAHYYGYELQPVFAVTLLDEKARVLTPRFQSRQWCPAFLTQTYHVAGNIELTERRAVLPNDSLVSELTLKNASKEPRTVHLVMWTAQPTSQGEGSLGEGSLGERSLTDVTCDGKTISFARKIKGYDLACSLGINRKIASYSINVSQPIPNLPQWEYTPFYEKFCGGKLPNEKKVEGVRAGGLLYLALHTPLKLNPHARKSTGFVANISKTVRDSSSKLTETLKAKNPIRLSIRNWRDFFKRVPYFECSDKHLQKYYWYRWYGLRLFTVSGDEGVIHFPAVCEGPGYFHLPISYSAQAHMRETRWMETAEVARGSFLNFARNQRERGDYPGRLFPHGVEEDEFYHANWGESVLEVDAIHPDEAFLKEAYLSLIRYANYFDQERDGEGCGLYDVRNHYETGQEYSSRYLAVHQEADTWGWGDHFRLKGVEATVYMYCLKRALAIMADRLGKTEDGKEWSEAGERIKQAVLELMWDPTDEIFYDVDPRTMERTKVKAVTCFYPYMTEIVDESHIRGLRRHLLNPEEFWTAFPVATLSCDEPSFSPEAEWKGGRHHCPWNGRVWPMTNSHMVEALAHVAKDVDGSFKTCVVELMTKFIHTMFAKDDVRFPNCFEHYNPFSGKPSLYRGVDDYQHSWVVDLILKYLVGVQPQGDGRVVIDPLPFETDWVRVDRLPFRGHLLKVEIDRGQISLFVDGVLEASGQRGEKIEVELGHGRSPG